MKKKEDINIIYERASERLKLFRKFRGITQEELSDLSTFSRGFIGNIESKKTDQTFSLAVIYCFSQKLNIPIELFVKEDIKEELKALGINEN